MKTLKFTPELTQKILAGEKTSTWRLFDDKNLQIGDRLIFINKRTGDEFGEAVIKTLKVKTLGTLTDEDWIGHEKFDSEEEMYAAYLQDVSGIPARKIDFSRPQYTGLEPYF